MVLEFFEFGSRARLSNKFDRDCPIWRYRMPIIRQPVSADRSNSCPSLWFYFFFLFFLRERGVFGHLRISADICGFPQTFSLLLLAQTVLFAPSFGGNVCGLSADICGRHSRYKGTGYHLSGNFRRASGGNEVGDHC
jgi:hypothetical protein